MFLERPEYFLLPLPSVYTGSSLLCSAEATNGKL